jgi:hypothetical protein
MRSVAPKHQAKKRVIAICPSSRPSTVTVAPATDILAVILVAARGLSAPTWIGQLTARALELAGGVPPVITAETDEMGRDAIAAADGRRLALIGGDAALYKVVNVTHRETVPEIALTPVGHDGDLARQFEIPTDLYGAAWLAVHRVSRLLAAVKVHTPTRTTRSLRAVRAGALAPHHLTSAPVNAGIVIAEMLRKPAFPPGSSTWSPMRLGLRRRSPTSCSTARPCA